jgi:hypothetical protein
MLHHKQLLSVLESVRNSIDVLEEHVFFVFCPEDIGDMLLQNVGLLSTGYTALYPRRQN